MGVVSSMSVSLIDRGRLWGLIACHHYAGPHRPSVRRPHRRGVPRPHRLAAAAHRRRRGRAGGRRRRRRSAPPSWPPPSAGPRARLGAALTERRRHRAGPAARRRRRRPARRPAPAARGRRRPPTRVEPLVARAARRRGDRAPTPSPASCPRRPTSPTPPAGCSPSRWGRGDFLAWFRPGDAARGDLGRQPVRVEDRADRRRAAAEPAPVVRRVERDGARHLGARGASTRWPPPARWPRTSTAATLNRADEDNRLVAALQRTLLLRGAARRCPASRWPPATVPSAEDVVGGDWYDLVPLPGGKLAVVARGRRRPRAGRRLGHRPAAARAARPAAARRRAGRRARRCSTR